MQAHRNSALEFANVKRHYPVPNNRAVGLYSRAKISQPLRHFLQSLQRARLELKRRGRPV